MIKPAGTAITKCIHTMIFQATTCNTRQPFS